MKTNCRYLSRLGIVGFFMIYACLGCSGFGQKMEKWSTNVSETVKETLNLGDSETSADEKRKNSDVYFKHTSQYSWETMEIVADWYTVIPAIGKSWPKSIRMSNQKKLRPEARYLFRLNC